VILHNDRGPMPPDVPVASVFTVEVENIHDARCEDRAWHHEIPHPYKGYVIAQIFDADGCIIALPGVSRAWRQVPHGIQVPVMNESYYPITVVMSG
jgi:hypothetical protein